MLKIQCEHDSLVSVIEIKQNPKNANRHSEKQLDILVKLLRHQGWRHPLIISKRSGLLVAGHGRLAAAMIMGEEKVPVDYQDFESDEQEFKFMIADNEIARLSKFDKEKFKEGVLDLDLDVGNLDFDLFALDGLDVELEFPSEEEEEDAEEDFEEEAEDSGGDQVLISRIVITCPKNIKNELEEYLLRKVSESSFDGVQIT